MLFLSVTGIYRIRKELNLFKKYALLVTFLHELLISIPMILYRSVDLESPLI